MNSHATFSYLATSIRVEMKANKTIPLILFIGLFLFFYETQEALVLKAKQMTTLDISMDSVHSTGENIITFLKKIPPSNELSNEKFLSFTN